MDFQLEKLSADLIDEDFAKVFYGLHFQQGIMGRLNVNIKYGFATAPPKLYFFYAIAIWTTAILSLIGGSLQCEMAENSILINFYFKIGHVLNVFLVMKSVVRDMLQGNSGSEFYVKLQKIDRDLDYKDGKEINTNLAKLDVYLTICRITGAVIFVTVFNVYCFKSFCPFAIFALWPELSNISDTVVVTFVIYFVSIRVSYINKTLEAIKDKNRNEMKSCGTILLCVRSCSSDEIIWNRLLNGMKSISTVMADFIDLFQYQIFSYTCQLMIWIMITIQCSILTIKNQNGSLIKPISQVDLYAVSYRNAKLLGGMSLSVR
ncbi:uncharacterized protein LOC120623924 [Pararge aegeria]|uniref:uncharacterized protein LOC120623924 n=1 Tax=Pararge aegeria TaxID=116150 RepID=UPI0019D2564B|nr:uncharacterized protein LOC120623924 [Pararge aegeria]